MAFDQFVDERITKPLGMRDTGILVPLLLGSFVLIGKIDRAN